MVTASIRYRNLDPCTGHMHVACICFHNLGYKNGGWRYPWDIISCIYYHLLSKFIWYSSLQWHIVSMLRAHWDKLVLTIPKYVRVRRLNRLQIHDAPNLGVAKTKDLLSFRLLLRVCIGLSGIVTNELLSLFRVQDRSWAGGSISSRRALEHHWVHAWAALRSWECELQLPNKAVTAVTTLFGPYGPVTVVSRPVVSRWKFTN